MKAEIATTLAPAERKPAEHITRLKKLYELSVTLMDDPVEVFKHVAHMIGELFGVRVVCVSEVRGDELYFISVYLDGEVTTDAGHCPLPITPCATVEKAKDIRIYDRVAERFPQASFLKTHNAYSYCGFPAVDSSGKVVAVTCLLDDKPHHFSREDQELLRIIGQRIAAEIERRAHLAEHTRVENELIRRARQQAAVAELGQRALAGVELWALMDTAVEQVARILEAEYCKVLELLPEGDTLLLRAGIGWHNGLVGRATVGTGMDSQAGFTLLSSEPVIVEDMRTETRFSGPPLLHEHGVVSGMSVIIHGTEGPFGVLGVHTNRKRTYTKDNINFLRAVANVLAEAIERKRAEVELHTYRNHLEELVTDRTAALEMANKELEAFSYSVSHDLRAPLRSIDGFSQAMLEDYENSLDETGKDYLQRVRAASQRMGILIDDMLVLSQVTRHELHRESVDLSALVHGIAAQLEEDHPDRTVAFIIKDGEIVQGDNQLLRITMENLLGNAWKFTGKEDNARIVFDTTEKNGERVYYVRDNGVGFDMRYAGKLFNAFQRLHKAAEFEGTGIGLATVQRIIHRHGGRVWPEAEPGKGSTFYFTVGTDRT